MKHFFKALKNIKLTKPGSTSPSQAVKTLTEREATRDAVLRKENTILAEKLIPDKELITKSANYEDYIDCIFKQNPHLTEQHMYVIYHTHKPSFDKEVSKRLQHAKDTEIVSNLSKLRLKHKKNPENINVFFDKYVKEYSKLNKSDK